jgi:GT2 family glycosyltransferase
MPPLGSHAGRNHAIFRAAGELCVFVDDDVSVTPDFLGAHARAYEEDSRLDCVAGRVIQPRDGYSGEEMNRLGRPARYNRWLGRVSGNFFGTRASLAEHVHECNFSVKTSALRAVGGFNEEFQGNAYFEGADLALRLIEAGHRIEFKPDITLTHLQDSGGGNRLNDKARHTYWYMRNYGLLNSLHMHRVGLPAFSGLGFAYVLAKAAKNRDLRIAEQGLRGLADGLGYFLPGRKRLRTRSAL